MPPAGHGVGHARQAPRPCPALVHVQILRSADEWKALQESVLLLAKRRSQLKQVVQAMVRQCMGYLDAVPTTEARIELIKTLQALTEGKASEAQAVQRGSSSETR